MLEKKKKRLCVWCREGGERKRYEEASGSCESKCGKEQKHKNMKEIFSSVGN